jgi:hypothetical protein
MMAACFWRLFVAGTNFMGCHSTDPEEVVTYALNVAVLFEKGSANVCVSLQQL